jgi:hypothetical protein
MTLNNNKSKGTVTIIGDTAKIGTTLLIGGVSIEDKDGLGDLHYQWLSDGQPIEQETGNRYKLTKNDIGKILNVKVSYIDGAENAESVKSSNTKKVAAPVNNKPTGTIAITGDATKVGTELSMTNTIKDKDGLGEFNYQWLRDGKAIDSATSDKYTLSQEDKGKSVNVQVSYTDGAGTAESVKSSNTKKVAAGTTTTANPTTPIKVDLSGPANVNEGSAATYTATLSKALTSAVSIPYALSGTGITINGDEFTGVTSPSGNITIPAGSTTGSFTLNVINDSKTEGAETLTVKLGSMTAGSGVTLGTKSSVSTVIADTSITEVGIAPQSIVSLSGPANINEGGSATYTAALTQALTFAISIPYRLSGTGITINGDEFTGVTSPSGNITIPAGSTTGSFTLNVINDSKTEGAETLTVELGDIGTAPGLIILTKSSVSTVIADTSVETAGATWKKGTNGDDFLIVGSGDFLNQNNIIIDGLGGNDKITAYDNWMNDSKNTGNVTIYGGDGNDKIDPYVEKGVATAKIDGGNGNDILSFNVFGRTQNMLIGGGDADYFTSVYYPYDNTKIGSVEIIDFSSKDGDKIDLSQMDANTKTTANDAFVLISPTTLFSAAGQLKYNPITNILEGNTDTDFSTVEFSIKLLGVSSLSDTDFVL